MGSRNSRLSKNTIAPLPSLTRDREESSQGEAGSTVEALGGAPVKKNSFSQWSSHHPPHPPSKEQQSSSELVTPPAPVRLVIRKRSVEPLTQRGSLIVQVRIRALVAISNPVTRNELIQILRQEQVETIVIESIKEFRQSRRSASVLPSMGDQLVTDICFCDTIIKNDGVPLWQLACEDQAGEPTPVVVVASVEEIRDNVEEWMNCGCFGHLIEQPLTKRCVTKLLDMVNMVCVRKEESSRYIKAMVELRRVRESGSRQPHVDDVHHTVARKGILDTQGKISPREGNGKTLPTVAREISAPVKLQFSDTDSSDVSSARGSSISKDERGRDFISAWITAFRPSDAAEQSHKIRQVLLGQLESSVGPCKHKVALYKNVRLDTWDFDVFAWPADELAAIVTAMFDHLNLFSIYQISGERWNNFIHEIIRRYYDNPYHNIYHAVDIVQAVFSFITHMNAGSYLRNSDVMALLFAALCHDVEHPGLGNSFHVKTMSDLAIKYNDQSVLEMHHASVAFSVLMEHDKNIFADLSREDMLSLRKKILDNILATDMARHFEFLEKLSSKTNGGGFSVDSEEDRRMVASALIKIADISNVTRPFTVAQKWSSRIGDEFFAQGDQEKSIGLVPASFMDRDKTSAEKVSYDFANFVVKPLVDTLVKACPQARVLRENLDSNCAAWHQLTTTNATTKL